MPFKQQIVNYSSLSVFEKKNLDAIMLLIKTLIIFMMLLCAVCKYVCTQFYSDKLNYFFSLL